MADWRLLDRDWNALLAESHSASYFLSWEWLYSWAEVCLDGERQLFILTFREGEKLIGVAPLYIRHRKVGILAAGEVHFLGTPEAGSDFLDVFCRHGREKEVANALYDYLHGEGRSSWDQLHLTDVRAESLFLHHFMNRFGAEGQYAELTRSAFCPGTRLPATVSDLYPMLSPGWRKKFKQDMRVSSRDYRVAHEVISGPAVADQLERFFRMYEEMQGRPGETLYHILKNLVQKYPDEVPFQIDYLYLDGEVLAALFLVKFKDTLAMYLMAVDKKHNPKISLGNLLVGYSIMGAISAGYRYYDFLKGDERYKFHWSNEGCSTLQLHTWQRRPAGFCLGLARLARNAGKVLLR